jgi:hypothetical protein
LPWTGFERRAGVVADRVGTTPSTTRNSTPAVDFLHDDNYAVCPVKGCGARAPELASDEPDCDHEYPGRCTACDTVVGDRYSDLVWMGRKLGVEQWLCERCRGYCEACDGEGKITFDGVCGDCCTILAADGAVLHKGKRPALELRLGEQPRWIRIDDDAELFVATEPVEPWPETEPVDDIPD